MPERFARTTDADPSNRRLRLELILASVWLAVGLFVVPAMIFWVGIAMLGPYGEAQGSGMGSFYADFFGDLATGEVRTWLIALGPLILISLLRAIFLAGRPAAESTEPATHEPAPQPKSKSTDHRRVEPSVGD